VAIETGQQFSAPFHRDLISQPTRDIYVYFLSHGGPERAVKLFENVQDPSKAISLEELNLMITDFPYSLGSLEKPNWRRWRRWRMDNLHSLGEKFLHYTNEVDGRSLLFQSEIIPLVRQLAEQKLTSVFVDPETLRVGDELVSPVFAGSLSFTIDSGIAALSSMYDFRATIPSMKFTESYQEYLRHVYGVASTLANQDTRTLLEDVVRASFNVNEVRLPRPEDTDLTLVSAYRSPRPQEFPERLMTMAGLEVYFDNRLAMGVDLTPFSYMDLQYQLGRLPQVPPIQLFKAVNRP